MKRIELLCLMLLLMHAANGLSVHCWTRENSERACLIKVEGFPPYEQFKKQECFSIDDWTCNNLYGQRLEAQHAQMHWERNFGLFVQIFGPLLIVIIFYFTTVLLTNNKT